MAYKILYRASVGKDLKTISIKEAEKILTQIESIISIDPFSYPMLKGEFKGYRKFKLAITELFIKLQEIQSLLIK